MRWLSSWDDTIVSDTALRVVNTVLVHSAARRNTHRRIRREIIRVQEGNPTDDSAADIQDAGIGEFKVHRTVLPLRCGAPVALYASAGRAPLRGAVRRAGPSPSLGRRGWMLVGAVSQVTKRNAP